MTRDEWFAEGERRFGPDKMKWRFVCPSCGHIASVQDYHDAGAPEGAVAFSCVGRWSCESKVQMGEPGHPCNYAGGGLFQLNPVEIEGEKLRYFDFAEPIE